MAVEFPEVQVRRPRTQLAPEDARFDGVQRPYSKADVMRLRGTLKIEHTLASVGARRLWQLLHEEGYVPALGAVTGNQAVQIVRAGRGRREHRWTNVPRSELVSSGQRPECRSPNQRRSPARRPDRSFRREVGNLLVRSHRGGRGGGLRRTLERI